MPRRSPICLPGADAAVDDAKARQRGSLAFYNQKPKRSVQRRRTMAPGTANAIDNEQLELHYLPTVELAGGPSRRRGLVRWEHPLLGSVGPNEFIPMAEHNTLIHPIEKWVFRRALDDITALGPLPETFRCSSIFPACSCAFPSSLARMRELLSTRPEAFPSHCRRHQESVAMQDPDTRSMSWRCCANWAWGRARRFRHRLFGAILRDPFPINIIKIDRLLIERLPGSDHDATLVEVLLGIAQRFGFLSHAEGIETEATVRVATAARLHVRLGLLYRAPDAVQRVATYLTQTQLKESDRVFAILPRLECGEHHLGVPRGLFLERRADQFRQCGHAEIVGDVERNERAARICRKRQAPSNVSRSPSSNL